MNRNEVQQIAEEIAFVKKELFYTLPKPPIFDTITECWRANVNGIGFLDVFPVSISMFSMFVHAADGYFSDSIWYTLSKWTPVKKATPDSVMERILYATGYDINELLWEHFPVTNVTWHEAMAYCTWRNCSLVPLNIWVNIAKQREHEFHSIKKLFLPRKLHTSATHGGYSSRISREGLWGMPGGIYEWCSEEKKTIGIMRTAHEGGIYNFGPFLIHENNEEIGFRGFRFFANQEQL